MSEYAATLYRCSKRRETFLNILWNSTKLAHVFHGIYRCCFLSLRMLHLFMRMWPNESQSGHNHRQWKCLSLALLLGNNFESRKPHTPQKQPSATVGYISRLSPLVCFDPVLHRKMHKAILHFNQQRRLSVASSTSEADSTRAASEGPSTPVYHLVIPWLHQERHNSPITATSKPDASWTGVEYAQSWRAMNGAYPMFKAFDGSASRTCSDVGSTQYGTDYGSEGEEGEGEGEGDEGDDEGLEEIEEGEDEEGEEEDVDVDNDMDVRRNECDILDSYDHDAVSEFELRPQDQKLEVEENSTLVPNLPVKKTETPSRESTPKASVIPIHASKTVVLDVSSPDLADESESEDSSDDDEYDPLADDRSVSRVSKFRASASSSRPLKLAKSNKQPSTQRPSAKRKFVADDSDNEAESRRSRKVARKRKGGSGGKGESRRTPYKCPLCPNFYAASGGDLSRHLESLIHKTPSYICEVPGCGKAFTRKDALKRHAIKTHKPGGKGR
ncbi:hypothetical protein BDZ97DRAFT_1835263 [Flammula alnicola]|nr:hypothetical protein BDZ97DRAFT_1835263 [Flammula alnicola]